MSTPIDVKVTIGPPKPDSAPPVPPANGVEGWEGADTSFPFVTFPPFPAPPAGVEITPFRAFKPSGIQIELDPGPDYVERDGLGIPTVELRVKHEVTEAERKRKGRKSKNSILRVGGAGRKTTWNEDWEVDEKFRRTTTPIDPSLSRVDRLHQAAQDFRSGRPWPAMPSGVMQLWDWFRLYIGIISSIQPPPSKKRADELAAAAAAEQDDDDDDDFGEGDGSNEKVGQKVVVANQETTRAIEDARIAEHRPAPKEQRTEEERQARKEYFREAKERNMDFFLNDTEKSIKVFFSSFYRDKGLMWTEQRCRDGPILIEFFLNFLLRNRVLPEPDHERNLRKALAVSRQARIELPQTWPIAKAIPDQFHAGCIELFGKLANYGMWSVAESDTDEPDLKRRKVDDEQKREEGASAFKEAVGEADMEILSPDVVNDLAKTVGDEDKKDEKDEKNPEEDINWGPPVDDWAGGGDWTESADNTWNLAPAPNPLKGFLGPTALPLTHTTGIVEESMRRIVSISPPTAKEKPKKKKGRAAAELIEEELGRRFAKVVMAPWPPRLHPLSDMKPAMIRPGSRGTVVSSEGGDNHLPATGAAQGFDPSKDHITLLVEQTTAETLLVGIGLKATWIQIVRQDVSKIPQGMEYPGKKHKGGWGEPGETTAYWYAEQVQSVIPSFHDEP